MDNVIDNIADSYEDMASYSPEKVAQIIFAGEPMKPNSHMILAYHDTNDSSYLFEIMITIFMEGMDILSGGLDKVDLTNFNQDYILGLSPWFNSLGFKIHVFVFDKQDIDKYEDYYCKIILNNNDYGKFFEMKNIHKSYHFLCNQKYINGCKNKDVSELYGLFVNGKIGYKVNFTINS